MQTSIARDTLTNYLQFSERDTRSDFQQGKEDGQRNYPPPEQTTFSQHELTRIKAADRAFTEYARRLNEEIDSREERIHLKRTERDQTYPSQKEALVKKKQFELERLRNTEGENSSQYIRLREDEVQAKRDFQQQQFVMGRNIRLSLHQRWFWKISPYIALLSLLALLEVPINELAIELAFQFGFPWTYVIALLVGTIFVLLSHFAGISIQRLRNDRPGQSWAEKSQYAFGLFIIFVLAGTLIWLLFEMRGQVAAVQSGAGGLSLDSLLSGASNGAKSFGTTEGTFTGALAGIFDGARGLISGDSETLYAKLGLLALNTLVFFGGMTLSIIRHDPDGDYERVWWVYQNVRDDRFTYLKAYREKAAAVDNKFSLDITRVEDWADKVDEEIRPEEEEVRRLHQQCANDMRIVVNVVTQQVLAYQKGNEQAREHDVPAYFGKNGLASLHDLFVGPKK